MRILYLSLSYVPSRRASSVQVMRMCEAFAAKGHDVTLVTKRSDEHRDDSIDVHSYYGVHPTFEVVGVHRPSRRGGELWFAAGVARQLAKARRDVDLVYARDLVGGTLAAQLGFPVVYEAHGVFEQRWQQALWRRMLDGRRFTGLVAISQAMVRELAGLELLPRDRPVIVAHSPANTIDGATPRPELAAPPRIGYIGSLYPGRGIDLVIDVARRMPRCAFELVGGSESDLARWRTAPLPANVMFRGFVPPSDLPAVYRTFDVLLMPYPHLGVHGPTQRIDTARYCSPMKMFEYMASGVPMVASDLPVLQEVLAHGANALVAPYGDVGAWQEAIERLLDDNNLRTMIAGRALRDVADFTCAARADRILRGLGLP